RTTSAWGIRDASGGAAEANSDDPLSFAGDALFRTTTSWSSAFSGIRYEEFDLYPSNPAGLSVTVATFNFDLVPNTSTDTACFYFEVRQASTGTVLGTHGSSASPVAC